MYNTIKLVGIDQFRKKLIDAVNTATDARTGQDLAERIADHLIANGITFATDNNVGSKWIPVTEQLPKYFGTFLVAIEEVHGEKRISVDAADFDPFEKKWATFGYFCAGFTITHWMPLPEPPKEGE